MRNVFFSCVILLGLACGLFAQEVANSNYVIGEEDVLSIEVWREDDLSVKGRSVRADGMITMPLLGDIYAAGKTTKQLQDEIAEKLKDLVVEPYVTVQIEMVLSHKVSISGQVGGKAGQYAIGAPATVLDIINRAGGLSATAKAKKIKIVRIVNGREVHYPFNYKEVLQGKNLHQNILMENGDQILVP